MIVLLVLSTVAGELKTRFPRIRVKDEVSTKGLTRFARKPFEEAGLTSREQLLAMLFCKRYSCNGAPYAKLATIILTAHTLAVYTDALLVTQWTDVVST